MIRLFFVFSTNLMGRLAGVSSALLINVVSLVCCETSMAQSAGDFQHLIKLGHQFDQLKDSGQIDEAAKTAEETMAYVERRFGEQHYYLGLGPLAQIRALQGRYEETIQLGKRILKLHKRHPAQNRQERNAHLASMARAARLIGVCLEALGRYEKALPYIKYQVDLLFVLKEFPDLNVFRGEALTDLAKSYDLLQDRDNAAQNFQKAAKLLEAEVRRHSLPSEAGKVLANTLEQWADHDASLGRYDLAEPKLRRALDLNVSVNGWRNPNSPRILLGLAKLYDLQGRHQDAAPYWQAASEVRKAMYGTDHLQTVDVRTGLAWNLFLRGHPGDAETLYREAIEWLEANFGSNNVQTAKAKSRLARVLVGQDKYDEAAALHREAIEASETVDKLLGLATVYSLQNKWEEVLRLLDRVARLREINAIDPQLAQVAHAIKATALWHLGKRQSALNEMETSFQVAETIRAHVAGAERERATMVEKLNVHIDVYVSWNAELSDVAELFRVMEGMKARSFLDELRARNVDLLAGLPDSKRRELHERESQLRRELTAAEQKFDELPEPGENPPVGVLDERKKLTKAIYDARDQLYKHLTDVRSQSPAYRNLIAGRDKTVTLAEVQQQLEADELLLSYFTGSHNTFVTVIRRILKRFT